MFAPNIIFSLRNYILQLPQQSIDIPYLDIAAGDRILLTGNSGSGKSTLLLLLKGMLGLVMPDIKTSGTLLFKQQPQLTINPAVYLVGQNPDGQFIHSCIYDELAFNLENLGYPTAEITKLIDDYIQIFGLNFLQKKTNQLSSGEKHLINIIAALLVKPEVLLLDEPSAALSPQHCSLVLSMLQQLAPQAVIIIAEHQSAIFELLFTRYWHLDKTSNLQDSAYSISAHAQHISVNYSLTADRALTTPIHATPNNYTHTATIKISSAKPLFYVKHFAPNPAFNELILEKGDILGITGNNGTGKSQFLHTVAKFSKIANNSLFYQQQDINKIQWKRYYHEFALLLQNPAEHFLYNTVQEEVSNAALLAQLGLDEYLTHAPRMLSAGQQRRLSLGIVLSLERNIYLLDEPSVGQDTDNQQLICKILQQLQQQGKSFIIISHNKKFLAACCNKYWHLSNIC